MSAISEALKKYETTDITEEKVIPESGSAIRRALTKKEGIEPLEKMPLISTTESIATPKIPDAFTPELEPEDGGIIGMAQKELVKHPRLLSALGTYQDSIAAFGNAIKQTVTRPETTGLGADVKILKTIAALEKPAARLTGLSPVQDFTNKITARIEEDLKNEDEKTAYEGGKFIGSFIPYIFAESLAGAAYEKAAPFLATKIPTMSLKAVENLGKLTRYLLSAGTFAGTSQAIDYEPEEETRAQKLKNDLITFAAFSAFEGVIKALPRLPENLKRILKKTETSKGFEIQIPPKGFVPEETMPSINIPQITTAPKSFEYKGTKWTKINFETKPEIGDILYHPDVGHFRVQEIRPYQTAKGKTFLLVLKDMEGNIYKEPITELQPYFLGKSRLFRAEEGKISLQEAEKAVEEAETKIKNQTGKSSKEIVAEAVSKDQVKPSEKKITEPLKKEIVSKVPKSKIEEFTVAQTSSATPKIEEKVSIPRGQLPVGGGEIKISELERRISESLNASKEAFDTTTYEAMVKKDQIAKAARFVTDNEEEALAILRGEKESPKGLLRNSVYVALANKSEGNVALATKLASLASTRVGQEISILTEIDPNNPIRFLKDLMETKKTVIESDKGTQKLRKKMVKDLEKIIRETKIEKNDWDSFLDSIKC